MAENNGSSFLEEEREDRMERMFFEEAIDRHAKSRDAQMKERGLWNLKLLERVSRIKSAERLVRIGAIPKEREND